MHIVEVREFRRPNQADVQESDVLLERDDVNAAEESEDSRGRSPSHDTDACDFFVHFNVFLGLALTGCCRHFDLCPQRPDHIAL
jgi:hypothetical protein